MVEKAPTELAVDELLQELGRKLAKPETQVCGEMVTAVQNLCEAHKTGEIHPCVVASMIIAYMHGLRALADHSFAEGLHNLDAVGLIMARNDLMLHIVVPRDMLRALRSSWQRTHSNSELATRFDCEEAARQFLTVPDYDAMQALDITSITEIAIGGMEQDFLDKICGDRSGCLILCAAGKTDEETLVSYSYLGESISSQIPMGNA